MNTNNIKQVNEIDMECKYSDDDDSFTLKKTIDDTNDTRSAIKTGIMLDFSDDDEVPLRTITADIKNNNINITKNFNSTNLDEYSGINNIDMECKYGEDDDFIAPVEKDDTLIESGLIPEDNTLTERKKSITPGQVEDDYWKKLTAKHKKSNTKGAYNTSFHIAGNPEKEMTMFNHMMGTDSILTSLDAANSGTIAIGDSAGSEGSCSESLNNYSKNLKDLFYIIGFKVVKNATGFSATDMFDQSKKIYSDSLSELVAQLGSYINKCFILPLEIVTDKTFKSYNEWCDWYNDPINKKQYPKIASDIKYLDILANHLKECNL